MKRSGWIVLAVSVLSLGAVAIGIWWARQADAELNSPVELFVALLAVGAFITIRAPEERVGPMMLFIAVLSAISVALEGYWYVAGLTADNPSASARWALWGVQLFAWWGFYFLVFFLPLLFPDGRPPSRRWNWLLWLGLAVLAVGSIAFSAEGLCVDPSASEAECPAHIDGPIPVPADWSIASDVAQLILIVPIAGGLVSIVIRYRSSRTIERQQLKWFLFSVAALIGLLSVNLILGDGVLPGLVWTFAFMAPLVAIAIAITRYRLYDIDRIISRTVGYSLVVVALAGLYGLVVVGIPVLIPAVDDSQLLIAAATLLAFFLFNPLRKWILAIVDRRFYRSRYDAERVVEEFSSRLRNEVDLEELTADWVGVAQETVQPSSVSVWVRDAQ